jgi:hypothetical protein
MRVLPYELIQDYRLQTFRLAPGLRLKDRDEAVQFVNQRGFVLFWPINGVTYPSLWTAVAGDRPVADAHDDPGHITWRWKDSLVGSRAWYYAKVLRKKATMIAIPVVPYFYALTENYGDPEEDYLILYQQGRMTQEAKIIYETLLDHGALDTVALRKAAHMTSQESESRFNKAITDLQADFKILPVAVTQAGAWRYAFAYDLVTRQYPEIIDQTRFITEKQARQKLAEVYFLSLGAAPLNDFVRFFGWQRQDCEQAVNALEESGILHRHIEVQQFPGEWIASNKIVNVG